LFVLRPLALSSRLHATVLIAVVGCLALPWGTTAGGQDPAVSVLHQAFTHLRTTEDREWSSFPKQAANQSLTCTFQSPANTEDWTLSIRQQDVKQAWTVLLNDNTVGRLVRDENDLITDLIVPPGMVNEGDNELQIRQTGQAVADDIRVGTIQLAEMSPTAYRRLASVQIAINNKDLQPTPGRITVVNSDGTLIPVGADSTRELAVREGVVYSSTGVADFGVAPGNYLIYATRGFEYGVGATQFTIESGQHAKRTIELIREVDTSGWISCDTHIHTLSHSGHGDATITERMVTLVGEGMELPIATEHNKHIDYAPIASQSGVISELTAVIGNEVTTPCGHFNIFPVQAGATVPDHQQTDWGSLFDDIFAVPNVRVAILNHGRDLHSRFRPLSPQHHISIAGERLDSRPLRFNAMELLNSGAIQTDPMQLFGDWCGLLNRGMSVTPVGSSDSHDVTRFIVGQGRTYIRGDDADVANLNIEAATDAFIEGRVLVSYGLLATLSVNNQYGPGETVLLGHDAESILVTASLRAPSWATPESISLYVNGRPHRSAHESLGGAPDSPFDETYRWRIPLSQLAGDAWLCVVAKGAGIEKPYWPTAKPYQPDSVEFVPYTFACSGPVRVDVDRDGQFSSAHQYARRIIDRRSGDLAGVMKELEPLDPAVAIQAASILASEQVAAEQVARAVDASSDKVRGAFADYQLARRQSMIAQLEQNE
jgi:hypothetical protein